MPDPRAETAEIRTHILRLLGAQAPTETSFHLHLVAHQWALATALAINSIQDFQSIPKLKVEPYDHQVEAAITFFRRLAPRGMIADDVGLGKTITAGLILAELATRRVVRRYIVVCPKLLVPQWKEELEAKFGLKALPATGGEITRALQNEKASIITTYDTASQHMEAISKAKFDLAILDEAHKLRKLHGVPQPSRRADRFFKAMKERVFRYVLMLTATPLQTSLWDVYSLIDILRSPDPNSLGNPDQFKDRYLAPDGPRGARNPRSLAIGQKESFRQRLSETVIRKRRLDTRLNFPTRTVHTEPVKSAGSEAQFIEKAANFIVKHAQPLERVSLLLGLFSSPLAFAEQLRKTLNSERARQLGSRAEIQALVEEADKIQSSGKLERVKLLVEELRRQNPKAWRVIIFTSRLETLRFIEGALKAKDLGDVVGFVRGGHSRESTEAVRRFMLPEPEIHVLVSTDAGAEGLNLQQGNVILNYDLPWNPMVIEQRIGRVQRLGQKARNVIVYNLTVRGSIEERVVVRLMERLKLFETAIGEMEAILSEVVDDGDAESMEQVILNLVQKSLEEKDIEEDLRKRAESIEAARKRQAEAEAEVEQHLGKIDPGDERGPTMPKLEVTKPDLGVKEFTLGALTEPGGTSKEEPDGETIEVSRPGEAHPRKITFNPDHPAFGLELIGAARIALFEQGSRAFEHLVHEWMEKSGARTGVVPTPDDPTLCTVFSDLLRDRGLVVPHEDISISARRWCLAPQVTWKANVSVFHDQYEKLLVTNHANPSHGIDDAGLLRANQGAERAPVAAMSDVMPDAVVDEIRLQAADLLKGDKDIRGFSEFYEARKKQELQRLNRVKDDQATHQNGGRVPYEVEVALRERKADVERRFSPQLRILPVAVEGAFYESVTMSLVARGTTEATPVRIEWIPASKVFVTPWRSSTGKELKTPAICPGGHLCDDNELGACAHSDCSCRACTTCAPRFLKPCALCSGSNFCASHLAACSECEKLFCSEHLQAMAGGASACSGCSRVCEVSGERVPRSSLATCVVTGKLVKKDLLQASELSGELALPDHLVKCEESGRRALPNELVSCCVTAKKVAPDLTETSAESGKVALKKFIESCAETRQPVLADELDLCEETKSRVRKSLLETCGRTRTRALGRLMSTSAVSGVRALTRLGNFSVISGKWALEDELLPCESSGKPALPSELEFCSVTGKRVNPALIDRCAITGKMALKSELAESAVSGKRVLKTLLVECPVTHRLALDSELATCEVSGRKAIPSALQKCAFSGTTALPEYLALSLKGRPCLKTLMSKCEVTGRAAHPSELEVCAVSGRKVAPDALKKCAFTGKKCLPEFLAVTASGKLALVSETTACEASGGLGHVSELVACQETGKSVLPEYLGVCSVTKKSVLKTELGESAVSGRLVLRSLLCECSVTHRLALDEEMATCEASGKRVFASLLKTCEFSGARVLPEFLAPSLQRKSCLKTLLTKCEVSGRAAHPSELETCQESGKSVAPDRLATCSFTGKRALPEFMGTTASGRRALKREIIPCEVSGRLAHVSELQTCEASGRRALDGFLVKCSVSGKRVCQDLVDASSKTRSIALKKFVVPCPVCDLAVLTSEGQKCSSCTLQICNDCFGEGHLCDGCSSLRRAHYIAGPVKDALARAWPSAAEWKAKQVGTYLYYGLGRGGLMARAMGAAPRLVVLRMSDEGEEVLCNKQSDEGKAWL